MSHAQRHRAGADRRGGDRETPRRDGGGDRAGFSGGHAGGHHAAEGRAGFAADLLRRVPRALEIECLNVASYHGDTESSGRVDFLDRHFPDVRGRHVLLLDDILDTGRTLTRGGATVAGGGRRRGAHRGAVSQGQAARRGGRTRIMSASHWRRVRRRLRARLHGKIPEPALSSAC